MAHPNDRSCIRIGCPDSRILRLCLDTASQGLKPGLQGLLQPGCSEAGMSLWQQQQEVGLDQVSGLYVCRSAIGQRRQRSYAELERLRLEALEKQRLKRMTAAASARTGMLTRRTARSLLRQSGGYAARRQKRRKLMSGSETMGPLVSTC